MAVRPTEEIKDVVKRYYKILLQEGFPVEKILLFGSYAKNKQGEESDIDLAIVLSKFRTDRFNTRVELLKLTREFEEVIEPHPFLSTEFNESDPFVLEILKTGETIYS
jgi:predicted nucleotidyltransferase